MAAEKEEVHYAPPVMTCVWRAGVSRRESVLRRKILFGLSEAIKWRVAGRREREGGKTEGHAFGR